MSDDFGALAVAELRQRRDEVREAEQLVSYRRRLLQAQLDIVAAAAAGGDLSDRLAEVLADAPSPGGAPARSVEVEAMEVEVEPLPDLSALDEDGRAALAERLATEERAASDERRALLDELDALQAELVRRYREEGVDVTALLGGDR